MKRSVAIYGPTPSFVRWAIAHECSLRELDHSNLPDSTFRQLRGLREYSRGRIENQVVEGFCIHPTANSANPENALGFAGSEVTSSHGGDDFIENCCSGCPANAVSVQSPGLWAGCYGWLAANSGFDFESSRNRLNLPEDPNQAPESPDQVDFMQLMDEAIDQLDRSSEADKLFKKTSPRWYGIWSGQTLNSGQVDFLHDVLQQMVLNCSEEKAMNVNSLSDLVALRDALDRVASFGLTLQIESVPPGYSDGQKWTLGAFCPTCKFGFSADSTMRKCPACKRFGNPHCAKKSKVLGLRPYVQLIGIVGQEKTAGLLKLFESGQ